MKKIILFVIILITMLFSYQNKYNFNEYPKQEQKYLYYQTLYKIEKLKMRLVENVLQFKYLNPDSIYIEYLNVYVSKPLRKFVKDMYFVTFTKMNIPTNIRYKLADRIKRYNYYLRVRNYYAYGIYYVQAYSMSNNKKRYYDEFYKKIINIITLINRIELKILEEMKKSKLYKERDYEFIKRFYRLNIYYGGPFDEYSFYNFLKYMNRLGETIIN